MPVRPAPASETPSVLLVHALMELEQVAVGRDHMIEPMLPVGGGSVRLQCTPDLVPSDIVGTRLYRLSQRCFDVERGPVFADLVLDGVRFRQPSV